MRITVWNINGLRTLKGYQPWYKLPDWEACLEHLGSDIACFQETKMTRKQLIEPMCILPSYNAFFNFHPTKGYSGTVTYVRKSTSIPLKAEQGITGRLPNLNHSSNPAIPNDPIGYVPADTRDDVDPQIWNALDEEGRAVVLDLGLFVLFNVYCPNETGPERLEYKMTYYQCLAERAHKLIAAGREVMIVGDMNIIRDPIDHCDPEQSMKEHGWTHFHQHPARSWFTSFLAPQGKFHDVGREYHPERKKMFTCWNTLIDARPANYGCRLDYTLVTEGLLGWVKGADIQADVYGSDHCPIYVDLHDEREIDGKVVRLKDLMHGGVDRLPPALAACHYDEFSGKQRKLASFFGAKSRPATKSVVSDATVASNASKEEATSGPSGPSALEAASKSHGSQIEDTPSIADKEGEGSSLVDSLFSLHSQQEGFNIEHASHLPTISAGVSQSTTAPASSAPVAGTAPSPSPTPSPVKTAASQPSPGIKRNGSSSKKVPTATKASSKAKNGAPTKGQTSLQAFFAKPAGKTSTQSEPRPQEVSNSPTTQHESAFDTTETPAPTDIDPSTEGNDDEEDSISDFQADPSSTSPSLASTSGDYSPEKRIGASLAWGAIFSPHPAPLCRNHSEPCRAWTVNKPGPNHGRKFWLCNRPVGPGYEKSGRAKGDVNPEYRCNFFLWDSEVRSKRGEGKQGEGGKGKFFAELSREKARRKKGGEEGEEEEEGLRGPWGPHKKVKTEASR